MKLFVYVPTVPPCKFIKETAPAVTETASDVKPAAPALTSTILPESIDLVAANFKATLKPDQLARLNGQLEAGVKLAKSGLVRRLAGKPRQFHIKTQDGSNILGETVDIEAKTCTCGPFRNTGAVCKHRVAAYLVEKALGLAPQDAPVEEPEPPVLDDKTFQAVKASLAEPKAAPTFDGKNDPKPNPWLQPEMVKAMTVITSFRKSAMIVGIAHYHDQDIPVEIEALVFFSSRRFANCEAPGWVENPHTPYRSTHGYPFLGIRAASCS